MAFENFLTDARPRSAVPVAAYMQTATDKHSGAANIDVLRDAPMPDPAAFDDPDSAHRQPICAQC
jgi:two-component system nitrogen regulation sensor histidine kinase NtrY